MHACMQELLTIIRIALVIVWLLQQLENDVEEEEEDVEEDDEEVLEEEETEESGYASADNWLQTKHSPV